MLLMNGLALVCLVLSPGGQDAAPSTVPAAAPLGVLREEFFVLETLPADLDQTVPGELERPHAEARGVGLVAWRRRNDLDGTLLEWDLRFPREQTRVLHIEREAELGPSLVWREWRPDRGRTVIVEASERGTLRVLEWGQEKPVRSELDAGAVLPLSLLELLRSGGVAAGTFPVFDPLAGRLEPLTVRARVTQARARPATAPAPEAAPTSTEPARRLLELLREDGSLAGAYVFEGSDLVAFQWQAGGLRARRIDAADYLRRLREAGSRGSDD